MTRQAFLLTLVAASLAVAGCSGFSLRPVSPQRTTAVQAVEVHIDPAVDGKKLAILEKLQVATHMQGALAQSFAVGAGPIIRVTIIAYRTSSIAGRTHMRARLDVVDDGGAVTRSAEVSSSTTRGSNKTQLTRRVSQDIVNQIATQFQ